MSKKILCLTLALLLAALPALAEPLKVVVTLFPAYDWARAVVGDGDVALSLLLDGGVDMHSFQPTARDFMDIAGCDVFVYVGGESDRWVEDALREAVNPDLIALNLLDALGDAAVTETLTEGMQADGEEEEALDEHVWLSLRNARALTDAIADALAQADPDGADAYRANAAAYGERLAALDAAYAAAVEQAPVKTLLFGDRFPFRYLADDYGLECFAAFPGCSAETEASFETIVFLAGKLDELNLPAVLAIEDGDHRVAETVSRNAAGHPPVVELDSMQATDAAEIESGATYLGVMEQNLEALKRALGEN